MDLAHYTLVAVSVAATFFSVVLVVGLIVSIYLFKRVTRIADQFDNVSKVALETSNSLHSFVEKTTQSATGFMETFIALHGAREVVGYIANAITKTKNNKSK